MRTKMSVALLLALLAVGAAWAAAPAPKAEQASAARFGCCVTGDCCCPAHGACCATDGKAKVAKDAKAARKGSGCCLTGECCCPGRGDCCATVKAETKARGCCGGKAKAQAKACCKMACCAAASEDQKKHDDHVKRCARACRDMVKRACETLTGASWADHEESGVWAVRPRPCCRPGNECCKTNTRECCRR